jgi:hypothetical protein
MYLDLKILKIARSLHNEESNRNYPGFAHRGNVYLYLKRKEHWYVDVRAQIHRSFKRRPNVKKSFKNHLQKHHEA